jgi:hypothetical protein
MSEHPVEIKTTVYSCASDLGLINSNPENQKCISFLIMRRFVNNKTWVFPKNGDISKCVPVYRIKLWISKKGEESGDSDVEDDSELQEMKDCGNLPITNIDLSETTLAFIATIIYRTFKKEVSLDFNKINTKNYYYIIVTEKESHENE